jgi:hypothetical protein
LGIRFGDDSGYDLGYNLRYDLGYNLGIDLAIRYGQGQPKKPSKKSQKNSGSLREIPLEFNKFRETRGYFGISPRFLALKPTGLRALKAF